MKLNELLLELYAPVYVNNKKTLYLINNLIEKEFGIEKYDGSGGVCLLSQVIFSIAAASGIPSAEIAKHFAKPTSSRTGHSLEDLLDYFGNIEIEHSGRLHKLKLSFKKYTNINQVISEIKKGQPITLITAADHPLYDQLENTKNDDENPRIEHKGLLLGFTANKKVEDWERKVYHALLLVGYDAKYKMLIGRDSRHDYGYKGYFRVYADDMKKNFDEFALIAVQVKDVQAKATPDDHVGFPKFRRAFTRVVESFLPLKSSHYGTVKFDHFKVDGEYISLAMVHRKASFNDDDEKIVVGVIMGNNKVWIDPAFIKLAEDDDIDLVIKPNVDKLPQTILDRVHELSDVTFGVNMKLIRKQVLNEMREKATRVSLKEFITKNPATKGFVKDFTRDWEYEYADSPKFDPENKSHLDFILGKMLNHLELYNEMYLENVHTTGVFLTVKAKTSASGYSPVVRVAKEIMDDHDLFFATIDKGGDEKKIKDLWLITPE